MPAEEPTPDTRTLALGVLLLEVLARDLGDGQDGGRAGHDEGVGSALRRRAAGRRHEGDGEQEQERDDPQVRGSEVIAATQDDRKGAHVGR